MELIDFAIVIGYFIFIVLAAFGFRRFALDSHHFINGGNAMPWWMAGATAFMTQFSAWTFTGAAGKAFTDGVAILALFWGNALGFFIAARFFAARYRKLRVETPMDVIAQRFGRPTERLFPWLQFPLSTLTAAIWLNGLAYIISAISGIDIVPTLLVTGLFITLISASGGAWAVNATNVIQLVLILAITLITGAYALWLADGPGPLITHFPGNFWLGSEMPHSSLLLGWVAMVLLQQTVSTNNANSCYRFLVTRNEPDARKAARLAGVLFIIGPVMWFIPPWFSAGQGVDLGSSYPQLGEQAINGAYLHFVTHMMPAGTLGLALAAMLAATISPMSTALNRNAGIFIRNIYQAPHHSEARLLKAGRWITLLNGLLATLLAWAIAKQDKLGFFELVMAVSSLIQMPLTIPALLAVIVRRTPDWAGWSTVLVGTLVSASLYLGFHPTQLPAWLGGSTLTPREAADLTFAVTVLAHLVVTCGFFLLTRLWYQPKGYAPQRARQVARFFANLKRPLQPSEITLGNPRQTLLLGRLLLLLSFLLSPLVWLATDYLHGLIVLAVLLAGMGLYLSARREIRLIRTSAPHKEKRTPD
ncbi:TPA: hypothetical protein P2I16_002540 [Aeromonas salmonicida]|nr:hypothetical protein [Aeromonas salmonicida]